VDASLKAIKSHIKRGAENLVKTISAAAESQLGPIERELGTEGSENFSLSSEMNHHDRVLSTFLLVG
jgi:hypothetical protein